VNAFYLAQLIKNYAMGKRLIGSNIIEINIVAKLTSVEAPQAIIYSGTRLKTLKSVHTKKFVVN
jgi:hypothetical protein